jgi:hypothetical protein
MDFMHDVLARRARASASSRSSTCIRVNVWRSRWRGPSAAPTLHGS